jgi:Kef-type K+ transport system membrane component KefB
MNGKTLPYSSEILEVLGLMGLVIIVLEGALDLKISRKKLPLITKAFFTALLILIASTFTIGTVLHVILNEPWYVSCIYAIPLSVISSAIVIASLNALPENKREFAIYEATFSDIIGIMFFEYFLMDVAPGESYTLAISVNFISTLVISIVIALLLIYLFQYLEGKSNVKFFLFIAILTLLFSIGKLLHISSLLLIFIFGIILRNYSIIEKLKLSRFFNKDVFFNIQEDFHFIILETAFLIGTFFFLMFGANINVKDWLNVKVIIIGTIITAVIYLVRFVFLKLFNFKEKVSLNELFLAPRGLITIILFYKIPKEYHLQSFDTGIISFVVVFSIILMAYGIRKSKKIMLENEQKTPDISNYELENESTNLDNIE